MSGNQGLEYLAIKVASSKRELRNHVQMPQCLLAALDWPRSPLYRETNRLAIACRPRNSGIHRCSIERYFECSLLALPSNPLLNEHAYFRSCATRPLSIPPSSILTLAVRFGFARPRFFLADVSRFFGRQEYTYFIAYVHVPRRND